MYQSDILAIEHVATAVTLDLSVGVSGFEQQVVRRADPVRVGQQLVHVASAENLILMKTLAGRPQDDQDISGIVQRQGNTIDWDYCVEVAGQLEEAVDVGLVKKILRLKVNLLM